MGYIGVITQVLPTFNWFLGPPCACMGILLGKNQKEASVLTASGKSLHILLPKWTPISEMFTQPFPPPCFTNVSAVVHKMVHTWNIWEWTDGLVVKLLAAERAGFFQIKTWIYVSHVTIPS